MDDGPKNGSTPTGNFAAAGSLRSYNHATQAFADMLKGCTVAWSNCSSGELDKSPATFGDGVKLTLEIQPIFSGGFNEPDDAYVRNSAGTVVVSTTATTAFDCEDSIVFGGCELNWTSGVTYDGSDLPGVPATHSKLSGLGYYDINGGNFTVCGNFTINNIGGSSSGGTVQWASSRPSCSAIDFWTSHE